ncbi:MAG: ArsR/SmtB family transcription factor, partial [Candidatus Micrarchaeia archaeon]
FAVIIMDKLSFKVFFHAISDYSRFSILRSILEKEMSVSEIVAATGIEQSNVSHHLQCLLNCGMVNSRKKGKSRLYSVNKEARTIVREIEKHIDSYEKSIISCNIVNKEYLSAVIK